MKVAKYVFWAAVMTGAVVVGWLVRRQSAQPAAQLAETRLAEHAPLAASPRVPAAPPSRRPVGTGSSAVKVASGWEALLRESGDYYEFAGKAHRAATRGDAAAQWFLGLALNECNFVHDGIFLKDLPEGGMGYRTIDEAQEFMRMNMTQPLITSDEELGVIAKRCRRLSEAPPGTFGYGTDWTKAAATLGFPVAQATEAQAMAQRAQYDTDEISQSARQAEARTLAIEALRTHDPAVVREIAEVAAALVSANESDERRLPWLVAACLRSPNCDSLNEQMTVRCKLDPQCQPYETPLDMLRREAGNDFDEVERRAREINEKIDAGTIEESDI